jgi:Restriction endonuclease
MSPTSERLLLRPSVEARVQLDCVELLCVPAKPIPGCQRGLVQDGVPVVVAPSGRTDPDVTHSSPIAAFYPPSHAGGGLPNIHLVFSPNRSRPAGLATTRLSPPEHTRRTDRASSHRAPPRIIVSTTDKWNAHAEDASQGQQIPGWRIGMAEFTPPESRWRRRGRGSSMSHAWAINGPLRMAMAVIHG